MKERRTLTHKLRDKCNKTLFSVFRNIDTLRNRNRLLRRGEERKEEEKREQKEMSEHEIELAFGRITMEGNLEDKQHWN